MPLGKERSLMVKLELLENLGAKGEDGTPEEVARRLLEIQRTTAAGTRQLRQMMEELRIREWVVEARNDGLIANQLAGIEGHRINEYPSDE
jgi:hypothetical protein